MTAPTRRRRTSVLVAVVVTVLSVAAVAVGVVTWADGGRGERGSFALREYPAGERPVAPPVAGPLLEGGTLDLAELRGEVVVLNVWASWCAPCRAETDDLEQVYQATKDLGVSFVGLDIEDERDKAIRFMAGRVTYPSIFDPAFETGLGFTDPPAPIGPPATLVIDRAGRVAVAIYRQVGQLELEQAVRRVSAASGRSASGARDQAAEPGFTAASGRSASGARGQAAGPSFTAEEAPPDG